MSADWPDLTIPEAVRRLSARATLLEDTAEMLDALANQIAAGGHVGLDASLRSWADGIRRIAANLRKMASVAADRDLPGA